MSSFFCDAFGFEETNYQETQALLLKAMETKYDEGEEKVVFRNITTGELVQAGSFSTPTVEELWTELREKLQGNQTAGNTVIHLSNIVADVTELMSLPANENAVFQAASQFNCLEFVNPRKIPEDGISCYAYDPTQGPACAVACPAGTVFRNYCVPMETHFGQTRDRQINCLEGVEELVLSWIPPDSQIKQFWKVTNGYTDSTVEQLELLNTLLKSEEKRKEIIDKLRVGFQKDVQVFTNKARFNSKMVNSKLVREPRDSFLLVNQVYCSALSIGYSKIGKDPSTLGLWENFARLVLRGSYQATLLLGAINAINHTIASREAPPIYLTKLGGGVFMNSHEWIQDSIMDACLAIKQSGLHLGTLNIKIVHYGYAERGYEKLEHTF